MLICARSLYFPNTAILGAKWTVNTSHNMDFVADEILDSLSLAVKN